ncbi:hypothetical protein R1flu_009521 [Riccia fluitans]|uniref:Uncharacterized protein n=1 Tax=Riccia fluitans TaxID=41844 RepID=A0ABD1Z3F9_9MARC
MRNAEGAVGGTQRNIFYTFTVWYSKAFRKGFHWLALIILGSLISRADSSRISDSLQGGGSRLISFQVENNTQDPARMTPRLASARSTRGCQEYAAGYTLQWLRLSCGLGAIMG